MRGIDHNQMASAIADCDCRPTVPVIMREALADIFGELGQVGGSQHGYAKEVRKSKRIERCARCQFQLLPGAERSALGPCLKATPKHRLAAFAFGAPARGGRRRSTAPNLQRPSPATFGRPEDETQQLVSLLRLDCSWGCPKSGLDRPSAR